MSWKRNIEAIKKLHSDGSASFDKANGRILYEYATGSGKSKQAIDNILKDTEWWVILCWETAHIDNWIAEFKKWGHGDLIEGDNKRVQLICYASLKSYFASVESTYKINIVADEAHHMFSETYFPYVVRHAKRLQMLTATMPQDMILRMQNHSALKDVDRKVLTLNRAIELGILPPPGMYIIPITFDSFNRDKQLHIHKGAKVKWEKMAPIHVPYSKYRMYMRQSPLNMIVFCTEAELMEYHDNQCEYYKQRYLSKGEGYVQNLWKQAGSKRKRFIAEVKTEKARKFIEEYIGESRSIIFCGSVDQAIDLGGDLAVHSKLTPKQNRERIAAFQEGKTRRLYTNRMLREGMNLAGIEKAVIIQLDNKNLAFVQMAGRALRSDFPELFIFHAPLTQDDKYLRNSLKGINKQFIRSIDDYGKDEIESKPVENILLGLE